MTDAAPLDRMQQMADYRTTCKFLKRSGQQGIVFGSLFLLIGVMNFGQRATDYLYLGLGSIELLIGLHNRYYPSALGIVLDGILLILLGVWNLAWQAMAVAQGVPLSWFSGIFGVLVIVVGVMRFKRYPRIKAAFDNPPTDVQIAWFDDVVKEVQEATPNASGDVVEFRSGLVWKGKRFGDMVIFVDKMDFENLIVDRRDTEWTDKGKTLFGGRRHGRLRIGERTFSFAEFTPENLAVLEAWRYDSEAPESESEFDIDDRSQVPE